jgi:hypothetical protein
MEHQVVSRDEWLAARLACIQRFVSGSFVAQPRFIAIAGEKT